MIYNSFKMIFMSFFINTILNPFFFSILSILVFYSNNLNFKNF